MLSIKIDGLGDDSLRLIFGSHLRFKGQKLYNAENFSLITGEFCGKYVLAFENINLDLTRGRMGSLWPTHKYTIAINTKLNSSNEISN